MEGSDDQYSDAIDAEMLRLQQRISNLERITQNFKIVGEGIAGNFSAGFQYNPPDLGTDQPEQSE